MSNISSLCDEILRNLTRLGIPTAEDMLPGLSEDGIRELTAELPFVFPISVVELYKWSEGATVGTEFLPGFGMDSLRQMIAMYNELSKTPNFPRFCCGEMRWFPIFRSGGTDFYGVRCKDVAIVDGDVIYDDNEGVHRDCVTPPPIEFVNLEAMLQTLLCAYESGVYYINEQGQLAVGVCCYNDEGQLVGVDMSKFEEIARRFNPGLKRWERPSRRDE